MLYDQHIHSRYSQDGNASIEQIAQQAIACGLHGVTITDHLDFCEAEIGYHFYEAHESERREEFERIKEKYAGQLEIGWGIEVGHPYFMPDFAKDFLAARSFDFVLGSVHFLRDQSDIYLIDYANFQVIDRVLKEYFTDLLALLEFGGFDSLAHLDYPLRVMKGKIAEPTVLPYRAYIEPILREVIRQDLALEVNTRGFMDWKKRQEPEDWVLTRYRELGGRKITIGSDAHTIGAIGGAFDQAVQKLKALGFEEISYYRKRKPFSVLL